MLIIQEDNVVTMEEEALKATDDHDYGISGTANHGLANVLDQTWKGLRRITLADGMIKTMCSHKTGR